MADGNRGGKVCLMQRTSTVHSEVGMLQTTPRLVVVALRVWSYGNSYGGLSFLSKRLLESQKDSVEFVTFSHPKRLLEFIEFSYNGRNHGFRRLCVVGPSDSLVIVV